MQSAELYRPCGDDWECVYFPILNCISCNNTASGSDRNGGGFQFAAGDMIMNNLGNWIGEESIRTFQAIPDLGPFTPGSYEIKSIHP